MMDREAAAAALNNNEYRDEGSPELFAEMKAAGLVAVFGYSDDLIEFRGAIDDEQDAGEHSTHSLNRDGLLVNDCSIKRCPYFAAVEARAPFVEALWDQDGFSWIYKLTAPDGSAIQHETFVIVEDGEPYCRGIVFALADMPA